MPRGTLYPHLPDRTDPEIRAWRQVIGAVYMLALRDARRGCPDAQRFLQETAGVTDLDAITVSTRRQLAFSRE